MRGTRGLCAALLVLGLAGCGDDKSTGPQPEQITGTWTATRIEYVSQPPGTTVDLVALGGSGTLTLGSDHALAFVVSPPGEDPDTTAGTWQVSGDVFTFTPAGMPWSMEFDVYFSGNSLRLTGADGEFDFDGDESPDPATVNLWFTR